MDRSQPPLVVVFELGLRRLLEKIVGSQHHGSLSLDWPFEERTRCTLLNRIAQSHKLIYSLICLHIMLAFKIVHRRGADRAPHYVALIKHREINDHPIEVVAQHFTSLQRHCNSPLLQGPDTSVRRSFLGSSRAGCSLPIVLPRVSGAKAQWGSRNWAPSTTCRVWAYSDRSWRS